jgi:ketosteroid isomerase-like protein
MTPLRRFGKFNGMTKFIPAAVLWLSVSSPLIAGSPQSAADELLAADRAFAAAASKIDVVGALSAMFADEVVMTHAGGVAYGRAKAVEALKANPLNNGTIEWAPARVSVSGDGLHGFTAGFMTLRRTDGSTAPLKYLGYWEKQKEGWRVVVYKRGVAKTPAPPTPVSYVLPKQVVAPATDAVALEKHRESLAEAERSFSRDAQTMGIGPAFKHYGHTDAINLGGPDVATWLIGNDAIGGAIGGPAQEKTSPVSWGPEKTIVAASGDFGVTIGFIVPNKPSSDGKTPPGQPFFTIWRRDSPAGTWKYIAE